MSDYEAYFLPQPQGSIPSGGVKVTFFGTSSLLFDNGTDQILIDGFVTRPSILKIGFGKVKADTSLIRAILKKEKIDRLRAIFVCHSHYDHAMDAPYIAQMTGAILYGSGSTLNIGRGAGLAEAQMRLYEPDKTLKIGDFEVIVLHSKHTPPFKVLGMKQETNPDHPNIEKPLKQPARIKKFVEGGTFDFYIKQGQQRMMVKASTNFINKALEKYPTDVFFLGIAILGKQDEAFQNQYYQQTIQTTQAKMVVPIHWDSFTKPLSKPLTAQPNGADDIENAMTFLIKKTKSDNIPLVLLGSYDQMVIPMNKN